ncbi:DNA polymerase III subunit beta [Kaarinaea lacus]
MRFTIQRDKLLKPLQHVVGVVERRQTLPILSNVLIKASNNRLALTTTDLEIEMVAHAELDIAESGEVTLPARKFFDICRALPDEAQIDISIDNEKQRALIRSGKSRFNLTTLPAKDYPNIEEIKSTYRFSIAQSDLKEIIEKTHFAMAQQDVRFYLNGLLLEIRDAKVIAVATDGHRLSYCETDAQTNPAEVLQVILPRKGVTELVKILEDVEDSVDIEIGSNHVRINHPEIKFTTKLIDGKFPDYNRVVPSGSDKKVRADRDTLKQALARASILSNEKYRGVRVTIKNGALQAQAHNPEMEEAEEEIDVEYSGEDLVIGFNVNYLLDAVNAVQTEKVVMMLKDSNSSCLMLPDVEDSPSKYVIMPMRL